MSMIRSNEIHEIHLAFPAAQTVIGFPFYCLFVDLTAGIV